MTRVGFVGIGRIGSLLAASVLREDFPLVVHDLDRRACEQLVGRGARWAGSPREVAEATRRDHVPALAGGGDRGRLRRGRCPCRLPGGGLDRHEHERPTARLVASPRSPPSMGRHARGARHRWGPPGCGGRDHRARRRRRSGVPDHGRRCSEAMGGEVFHIGPVGSASTMKVITNLLAFVHLVAAGEAMMLARRAGLDPAQAFGAIQGELRQQLRARDRDPADPGRQLRHRLHDGPRTARISASPASWATSSTSRSSWRRSSRRPSRVGASPMAAMRGRRWS